MAWDRTTVQRRCNSLSHTASYFHFLWHSDAARNYHLAAHLCFRATDGSCVESPRTNDRLLAAKLTKVLLFGFYLQHCFKNMLPGQIRNSLWWNPQQSGKTGLLKRLLRLWIIKQDHESHFTWKTGRLLILELMRTAFMWYFCLTPDTFWNIVLDRQHCFLSTILYLLIHS